MEKLSIKDLSLNGKKVLMRVDFNVPLTEDGEIRDDTRIKASLPSIRYVIDHGGKLILMSHLGRPEGEKKPEYSLAPCAKRLSELLGKPVLMAPDCIGATVEEMAKKLKNGEILLLENVRFYNAETKPEKDPSFTEKLAKLGEVYINDAFGTSHRKHASVYSIAKFFPKQSAAGFLLEKEIQFLSKAFNHPQKPFYAIIGGSKISTKIGFITTLIDKVDAIFIGGGMAYTFLKAKGISIGKSIHEDDHIATAIEIMEKCKKKNVTLHLPEDIVCASSFSNDSPTKTVLATKGIPEGFEGVDIGVETQKQWASLLQKAKTIFWNGPLGVFEMENFAKGTHAIAKAIASTKAITIVGGGDSVAAIEQMHLEDAFSHVSTGGGASLELIEFGSLPGIEALSDK